MKNSITNESLVAVHARSVVHSRLALGLDIHNHTQCGFCQRMSPEQKTRFFRYLNRFEAQQMGAAS